MPFQSAHEFSQQDLLLVTTNPVGYMKKIQKMSDPLRNSCLAPFLRTCQLEHWPLIRNAGIIGMVEQASTCKGLTSMIHTLDAYTSCLRFVQRSEDGDGETARKCFLDTIIASRRISLNTWDTLKEIYDGSAGTGHREAFRSAIQQVLEQLSVFGDWSDNELEPSDNEEEIMFILHLLHFSRWHCLALHSWLYAPDSTSRRDSDATRTYLRDAISHKAELKDEYTQEVQRYIRETPPARILSQIRPIIRSQDAIEASLAFGLDLLISTLAMHRLSVAPWDGLEADICQVLWTILRHGSNETRGFAIARASNLLIMILAKYRAGPRSFRILYNLMKDHNGARLMARVAIIEAKEPAGSSDRRLFLIDHIMDMLKTENPPQSDGCRNLLSVTRDMLEPVWLQTTQHLRLLESEQAPQAKVLLEKWQLLGKAVSVTALVNPLVGCSWFMCPLYEEPSAKKMMLCKTCQQVQYCNARCQRGDWKAGHRERCRLVNP